MKKLFLVSLSVAAISSACFAQAKQAQNHNQAAVEQKQDAAAMEVQGIPVNVYAKSLTDQMTKDLKLTPGQSERLFEVNRNIGIKWSHAEKEATDRQHAKQAEDDINKFKMEQYQKVLTKDQYAKWANKPADASTR